MRYLAVKDNNRRILYKKYYIKRILFKYYILKNKKNINSTCYVFKLSALPKNSSKVRIKNRCVISYRYGNLYKLKISRFILKKYLSLGFLNGFKKSSW